MGAHDAASLVNKGLKQFVHAFVLLPFFSYWSCWTVILVTVVLSSSKNNSGTRLKNVILNDRSTCCIYSYLHVCIMQANCCIAPPRVYSSLVVCLNA